MCLIMVHVFALTFSKYLEKLFLFIKNKRFKSIPYPNINFHFFSTDDKRFNCARNVSTILCAHLPRCPEVNCSGHGQCVLGQCQCQGHWTGSRCDQLICRNNCSGQGTCTPGTALCRQCKVK